jgi:8-oxo-dGTP pyrophosphatase MutT (NUDIX family)
MRPVEERPIRDAASVICVRDAVGDPEVLVLERSARSRFLPGYVAFPGGAVEPADADLAARWFDDPSEVHRAAGVRELAEEVGLAVTAGGVLADRIGAVDMAPPSAAQLPEVAHWIAPVTVPVRFDARYFAVAAPSTVEPTPDGGEIAHAWWVSPARLLDEWRGDRRRLYWPTYYTVTQLATCRTVDELLALRFETREAEPHEEDGLPSHVFRQDR